MPKAILLPFAHLINVRFDWLSGEIELTVFDPATDTRPPTMRTSTLLADVIEPEQQQPGAAVGMPSPAVEQPPAGEGEVCYGKSIGSANMQAWMPDDHTGE